MQEIVIQKNNHSPKRDHNRYDSEDAVVTSPSALSGNLSHANKDLVLGTIPLIVWGLIFLATGLLSITFTITDMILLEKIKMRPWFPPYNLWQHPEPEVRVNIYIFTVENANEFLSGKDSKIKLKEIGPIVYREYLQHLDIVHHDNSTLSYSSQRRVEFLPHANKPGILNETITVPNFAVLAIASLVNEYNYFMQMEYNFLHRKYNDGLFINVTVYDHLWDYKSKLLQKVEDLAPSIVSNSNSGILYYTYSKPPDRFNVKIGTKYGDSQFFQINTINGSPTAQGYNVQNGDCYASVANSSEGVLYRQRVTKNSVLSYWAVCRAFDMYFAEEEKLDGILAFKYLVGPDVHDRKPGNETDCYRGAYGELQNGLSDFSKCYFGMPVAVSQPHFYGRSEGFKKKIEGLNASEENHSSFGIIEPKLGVPMAQIIRSQVNLVIPKFSFCFDEDYKVFSDMILPLFWLEYFLVGLTPYILSILNLFVNVVPIIEVTLTSTLFLVGFSLILLACVNLFQSKWKNLTGSKRIQFVNRRSKTDSC